MNLNSLNCKGSVSGIDQLIERWVATEAVTSKTFSNLHGDTDLVYYLKARIVNGYNGSVLYYILPNNDTGANYGVQNFVGANTTASAGRATSQNGMYLGLSSTLNNVQMAEACLYSKSGTVRTCLITELRNIIGTTVTTTLQSGQVWSNTADEITSIVVAADQTNGIGINSIIELWCRRASL